MTAAPVEAAAFAIRNARPGDWPLIRSSFLEWLHETEHARHLTFRRLKDIYKPHLKAMLGALTVKVAHAVDVEDEIAGWICYSTADRVIGFLYTKRDPWRRQGVARMLVKETGIPLNQQIFALHWSARALGIARSVGLLVRPLSFAEGMRLLHTGAES